MIKDLVIKNFRTHLNTEIHLSSGVNCFIGLPESGKTNIIRAINWVLTNRPLGQRVKADFNADAPTTVRITFDDGFAIRLGRDKKSEYTIEEGEEHQKMSAIGSDVPDAVSPIANMSELNLQKQLDKPFLICESPSEVGRVFNRVTRLEKVDTVLSTITTDINSANKEIRILEKNIEETKTDIKNLGDVDSMVEGFQDLQKLSDEISDKKRDVANLKDLLSEISELEEEMDNLNCVPKMEEEIKSFENLLEDIEKKQKTYDEITKVIRDVELFEDATDAAYTELNDGVDDYKKFLKTITVCPFCSECNSPISKHSLDDVLKGI